MSDVTGILFFWLIVLTPIVVIFYRTFNCNGHLGHRWSAWKVNFDRSLYQRRTCSRCGKTQETGV